MLVNIVGGGKLGKTLGYLIQKYSSHTIQGVCNRSLSSAEAAIQFIGAGKAFDNILALPEADITFITTADNQIKACCEQLATSQYLKPNSIIAHCSAILSSEILISAKNCLLISAHPMFSFGNPEKNIFEFEGTYCALESESSVAVTTLEKIFNAMGSVTFYIRKADKALYHCAGIFASNYVVTLFDNAMQCLKNSGIEEQISRPLVHQLMQSTLNNLKNQTTKSALTGPIQRGDIETVQSHIHALDNQKQKSLYQALGKATLELAELSPVSINHLLTILNKDL